jgi:type I restriction enzyme S subunit
MTTISSKNTGLDVLAFRDLKKIPFLLPPLMEQKRIVETFDKQFTEIDMMKKEVEKQKSTVDDYYKSCLNEYFDGHRKWNYRKFGELFSTKYGISKPTIKDQTTTKALKMNNISYTGELINLEDVGYLPLTEKELKRSKLKKHDLLFNRTNSAELVGKTTTFELDGDYVTLSYLVVATPKTSNVNSKFIALYLNSPSMKKFFLENCDRAISQANFSSSKLCEVQVPSPERNVQDKIVADLEKVRHENNNLKLFIQTQQKAIEQLQPAILNEVFSKYYTLDEV